LHQEQWVAGADVAPSARGISSVHSQAMQLMTSREVIEVQETLIAIDDPERWCWSGRARRREVVRFRTLGCWPVTGAVASAAKTPAEVLAELSEARTSERTGRVSDRGSLEGQKRDGYF
jgi:sulfate adenylyltransferase subunit 2